MFHPFFSSLNDDDDSYVPIIMYTMRASILSTRGNDTRAVTHYC